MMANFLVNEDANQVPEAGSVPSWLLAADNHNIGNTGGGSWFNPATWGEKIGNAGKFMATSALSGAASFYNSSVTVGNWFGAQAEELQTDKWINSIDSDLGMYYRENRPAADLVGFIATSILPGIGGVKVFNAGQKVLKTAMETGRIGGNMSMATGLLVPKTEKYLDLAKTQIAQNSATFSQLNANALKAYGAGFQQNLLDSIAFETAVFATMHQAPIFEDMDVGDVVKNIAMGALVGGAIGGTFEGVRSFYSLKRAGMAEDIAARPFSSREIAAPNTPDSTKIILMAEQRDNLPRPFLPEGASPERVAQYNKDLQTFLDTQKKINNDIREFSHGLAGLDIRNAKSPAAKRDVEIGNLLADTMHANPDTLLRGSTGNSHVDVMGNLGFAEQVSRVRGTLQVEKDIRQAIADMIPEDAAGLHVKYVRLYGDDAGKVTIAEPEVLSLADSVLPKAGESTEDAVRGFVKEFGFNSKKLWNPEDLKGHAFNLDAEARMIWVRDNLRELPDNMMVHMNDIPVLEHAFITNQWGKIQLVNAEGKGALKINSSQELYDHLKEIKQEIATKLLEANTNRSVDLIARTVNVSPKWLEGERILEKEVDDLFWRQGVSKRYTEGKLSQGLVSENTLTKGGEEPGRILDTAFVPEHLKVGYRIPKDDDINQITGHVVDGLVYFKEQEKLAAQTADRVFAAHAGNQFLQEAPQIFDSMLMGATRQGAGPGLVSFAAGAYGSLESIVMQLGSLTKRMKDTFKETAKESLNAPLVRLAQKQEAAIEFEVINRRMALTSEKYVYLKDGSEFGMPAGPGLISRKVMAALKGAPDDFEPMMDGAAAKLQANAEQWIPIKNEETADAIRAHVQTNGKRVIISKDIAAAHGKTNALDENTFYPIRPNPKDYPYVAFVKDDRVTGAGHTSMIHANSERELQELIRRVPPEYRVVTKTEAEEFKKVTGDYDFARALNENYIDADLKRRGIAGSFFPKTDPQRIVDDILNFHMRQEDVTAAELVRLKYRKQFDWLEDQGSAYSAYEASRYGAKLEQVEKYEKNPYMSYLKTALDVTKTTDHPLLFSINKALDSATSRVVSKVREAWKTAKNPGDLDSINAALKQAGYNNAYYDAALNVYANHPAPKGELTKFIRGANAILARFTLGLDPLNALNNIIGANVLRGTELKQVTRAIQEARPDLVGKLADLSKIALPGSPNGDTITAPSKLMANAIKRYWQDMRTPGSPLIKEYQEAGYIKTIQDQFRSMLDDFTLQGTENVADLNSRLQRAFEKGRQLGDFGEKVTGNTFAEEFNRFVSADVMRQITDVAMEAGVLTKKEAAAYINTFVARVEGNFIASQRPLVFQGPIGQAVGLFQSYQFNLMQNLFRYIGEGRAKDIAMLLGLQGTLYGLNGLPAFQAINEHIIGTASGNTEHKDMYDAAYGVFGKVGGEFLLYGAPSSLLSANIYSRGDVNPRQWTILPNSLSQVPLIGAYSRFVGSMYEGVKNVNAGAGVWNSFLEALEHNGISRPLAGIAQVARGATVGDGTVFSTSQRGTIMGSNDLASYASLVRLVGGRPMDEAIVNDAVYRIRAYAAVDRERKLRLAEAVKLETVMGQVPSEEQVAQFAERYAALGGKSSQFNKWMLEQYKNANTSQAQQIHAQLNNPLTQKLQVLMGGEAP
jgi:hypothetical protein